MKSNYLGILTSIKKDIDEVSSKSKRDISLIVVTKSQSIENIQKIINAEHNYFGENYVEEAIKKIEHFSHDSIQWHYIGNVQSNKIKKISKYFDWVQTISSIKHAKLLNKACNDISKKMNICIQVNIDREESKSGIFIEDLDDFLENILVLDNLVLRGLMALPSKINVLKENINSYKILRSEYDRLKNKYKHIDTLSIGMSNDYKIAMYNGSNMIRIGTLIFGERK